MDTQRLGAAIFLVLGLGMMTVSGLLLKSQRDFLSRSQSAQGKVVSVTDVRNNQGELSYRATVEWTSPDGKVRSFDRFSENLGAYKEGQQVGLLYDPADLDDVRSHAGANDPLGISITGGIGLVFAGIAVRSRLGRR
jgi:hypothetical protein